MGRLQIDTNLKNFNCIDSWHIDIAMDTEASEIGSYA